MSDIRVKQLSNIDNSGAIIDQNSTLGIRGSTVDWLGTNPDNWVIPSTAGGRLTPATNTAPPTPQDPAHPTSGVYSALSYVPYIHNQIALYDGSKWVYRTITPAEDGGVYTYIGNTIPVANGGVLAVDENYDVYIYWNGSALNLEYYRWDIHTAGNSARDGTHYPTRFQGVWVLSTDNTKRYIGTFRGGTSGFVAIFMNTKQRFLWNAYNQVTDIINRSEGTGINQTTIMAEHVQWGSSASPDTDYPIEIVNGMPSNVIFRTNLTVSSWAQTGVTVSNSSWRTANSIIVNRSSITDAQGRIYTVAHPSVTREGIGDFGTQKRAHVSLIAMAAGTLDQGYHYFRPMWRVEDVINCSGCNPGDVATLVPVQMFNMESIR